MPGTESYYVFPSEPDANTISQDNLQAVNIPIYVGIGLRIVANVETIGGSANVSGLGVIGAEADAKQVRGTLVVQTLGVNGKSVAAALPIQSELNSTTAQNAVVAVGAIKALLYSSDTIASPRVVGFYLPFPGGPTFVSTLVSAISNKVTQWHPQCGTPAVAVSGGAAAGGAAAGGAAAGGAAAGGAAAGGAAAGGTAGGANSNPTKSASPKGAKGKPVAKPSAPSSAPPAQ